MAFCVAILNFSFRIKLLSKIARLVSFLESSFLFIVYRFKKTPLWLYVCLQIDSVPVKSVVTLHPDYVSLTSAKMFWFQAVLSAWLQSHHSFWFTFLSLKISAWILRDHLVSSLFLFFIISESFTFTEPQWVISGLLKVVALLLWSRNHANYEIYFLWRQGVW